MSVDVTDCPDCAGFHPGQSCQEPEPEPEGCQAEFIDGSWYGDDCPECRDAVRDETDECTQCQLEDYCPRHENGVYG